MERRGAMYDPLVVDAFVACKDELAESLTATLEAPNNVEDLLKQPIVSATTGVTTVPLVRTINQLELQHAIRTVLETVNSELNTTMAIALLKDRSRDELIVADALGIDGEQLIGTIIPLGTRVSGWVAANARPIVNTDARLELPTWAPIEQDSVCSALPIRLNSDIAGVLVAVRRSTNAFGTNEIAFLERVCLKFDEAPLREVLNRASHTEKPQAQGSRTSVH
jgi:signal transduction protein with GAF and PtsI domain